MLCCAIIVSITPGITIIAVYSCSIAVASSMSSMRLKSMSLDGFGQVPKIAPASGSLGRAFFESLDGPAKWAEAPKRPEAGGSDGI